MNQPAPPPTPGPPSLLARLDAIAAGCTLLADACGGRPVDSTAYLSGRVAALAGQVAALATVLAQLVREEQAEAHRDPAVPQPSLNCPSSNAGARSP